MRTWRLLAVLGAMGLAGGLVRGTTVSPVEPLQKMALPLGSDTFDYVFEANKRAFAVVIGMGPPGGEQVPLEQHSMLGIYVYDAHGNCVAREDVIHPKVRDDLAVEWYPTETARHTVEIVNFGNQLNNFELAVK